jgi:uncharacterized protein (DUF1786 family)
MLNREKLKSILDRFPKNLLSNDEVFRDGGHGCSIDSDFSGKRGYRFVAVTGPQRSLAENLGYYFAVPYGDMMLTGCFGLVAALKTKLTTEDEEK